jgi:uncharacterized protein YutE (UPF0331/DUF86 family)/predicted nucleotidyltransferase
MEIKTILTGALNSIKRSKSISPKSSIELSALRWELYASLQNIIDATAIILSELNLEKPSSSTSLFEPLYKAGLVSKDLYEMFRIVARTRNILAHAYRKLESKDLNIITNDILPKAEELIKILYKLIENKNIDPNNLNTELYSKLKNIFQKHNVILAYIFGSRARSIYREDSDYDIAVLIDKSEPDIIDEITLSMEIANALNTSLDIDITLLNKADTTLKARIFKEGIPIYWRNEKEMKKWLRETYIEILNYTDIIEMYINRKMKNF